MYFNPRPKPPSCSEGPLSYYQRWGEAQVLSGLCGTTLRVVDKQISTLARLLLEFVQKLTAILGATGNLSLSSGRSCRGGGSRPGADLYAVRHHRPILLPP